MWPEHPHLELIRRKLHKFGSVDIPSVGYSMYPVIRNGDLCKFVPVPEPGPTIGRIVLFADQEGRLIGHRLIRREGTGPDTKYICKGDTNLFPDDAVSVSQMLGMLVTIARKKRNGQTKTIPANGMFGAAWGIVVRKVPGISYLLRKIAAMDSASHVQLAQKQ